MQLVEQVTFIVAVAPPHAQRKARGPSPKLGGPTAALGRKGTTGHCTEALAGLALQSPTPAWLPEPHGKTARFSGRGCHLP